MSSFRAGKRTMQKSTLVSIAMALQVPTGPDGPLTDEMLITRIARGDAAALESLYDRYAPAVLGIALKILGDRAAAEDVLQETFWQVWKNAVSYQTGRESFAGWLFRLARSLSLERLPAARMTTDPLRSSGSATARRT